ncbi:MAG: DUF4349 domain-containing protein [Candidatus Hydrogenedentes bacterium]|nr:DUF4349 domain-containing protein [Candidatus Hydrogenedentota bacterium]
MNRVVFPLLIAVLVGAGTMCGCAAHKKACVPDAADALELDSVIASGVSPRLAFGAGLAAPAAPGLAAAPEPAAAVAGPPGQSARLMVYEGMLALVVNNVADTIDRIKRAAEDAGGYMQSMTAESIVVKVPAAQFLTVLAGFGQLGEVTDKDVRASDITDTMRDLRIRLANAEEVRTRLVQLLERADKVEDAIKIEKELGRVTETIELLKGEIQALENRVAYSVITVHLSSTLPQVAFKKQVPFPWVRDLSSEMAQEAAVEPVWVPAGRGPAFELPERFAKYSENRRQARAMNAHDVLIKVERHDNVEGADLAFWRALAERSLTAGHALDVSSITDVHVRRGIPAVMICGSRELAGRPLKYLVALAATDKYVFAYEAWGPNDAFDAALPALERSIASLDVRR